MISSVVEYLQPVKIRVRIDPPHHPLCCKRRLNGGCPSDETRKTVTLCHCRFGTIKIPSSSKAKSTMQKPKFPAFYRQWLCLHISEKFLGGTSSIYLKKILAYTSYQNAIIRYKNVDTQTSMH
jgi:hypothetical protein